jgi:hypothetical protein
VLFPRVAALAPIWFAPLVPALSARQHFYPYAVGPPARGIVSSLPRVDRTQVPSDSPARRMFVLRVAAVDSLFSAARITRPRGPGPQLAGPIFAPSFALRGQPGPFRHLIRGATARARHGRILSAHAQQPSSRLFL